MSKQKRRSGKTDTRDTKRQPQAEEGGPVIRVSPRLWKEWAKAARKYNLHNYDRYADDVLDVILVAVRELENGDEERIKKACGSVRMRRIRRDLGYDGNRCPLIEMEGEYQLRMRLVRGKS